MAISDDMSFFRRAGTDARGKGALNESPGSREGAGFFSQDCCRCPDESEEDNGADPEDVQIERSERLGECESGTEELSQD